MTDRTPEGTARKPEVDGGPAGVPARSADHPSPGRASDQIEAFLGGIRESRGDSLRPIGSPSWQWHTRPEVWLFLANLIVFFGVCYFDKQRNFASAQSLQLLSTETAMLGIFAIGTTIVIVSGGIDLSVGSVIAFSSIIFTIVLKQVAPGTVMGKEGVGPGVLLAATCFTLAAALLVGMFHAALITLLDLPPFIATLGTLIGLRSLGRVIAQALYRSDKVAVSAPDFRALFNSTWSWSVPGLGEDLKVRWIPICVFLAVAIAATVLMRWTVAGRHLYALGGNEEAARLSGIRTKRLKYLAYGIGALCSGLAGILYAAREGQGNSTNMGMGYELNAIAAAVVGGASLRGGVGTLSGTILGALFLTLVVNGIPHIIKIESTLYEGIIVGVVVILAVAVNQLRGRRFRS
ncbi:MAG: ABC transporter permease [Planctomycetales bacterium]